MSETMKIPKMATIQKAANMTGVSYGYIRQLCLTKQIVFVKTGTKYLINLDKFIAFLNGETDSKEYEQVAARR